MSHHSVALSSGNNSVPLADWTIGYLMSGLHSGAPHTLVCPLLSLLLVDLLEFHSVDPMTIPHIDNDPDWVNAPIPVPIPVFQTPSPVVDYNPINNQLAKTLQQLLENLNRELIPKSHQLKACILDTFNGSDPHKLNYFLFQC